MLSFGLVNAQADNGKKLIEWGWDEPNPKFMRENAAKMDTMPFDGFVFHIETNSGLNASWKSWSAQRLDYDQFSNALTDLKTAHFDKLTDRFLRLNVTPGTVDWFDEDQWDALRDNSAVLARIAYETQSKGFMLDLEQYEGLVFDYRKLKYASTKSFAEYVAQVRLRGQEWMSAVIAQYPDVTIFLAYGYSLGGAPGPQREMNKYGLSASFLDGILDAATDQTKIIDGWEGAYTFKKREQFLKAKQLLKVDQLLWSANPQQYQKLVQAGYGLWADSYSNTRGWQPTLGWYNYFSPQQLTKSLEFAFEATDHYVWLYSEHPKWWTNENLSTDYIEAVRAARPK